MHQVTQTLAYPSIAYPNT